MTAGSPLTARMADALSAHSRRTVSLDELWGLFAAADPEAGQGTGARRRLAEALDELQATGLIEPQKAGWDRTELPPLPAKVRLPAAEETASVRQDARAIAWRPEMTWAANAVVTRLQLVACQAVNAWLRTAGSPNLAPLRERSLEIFGDEKRIDALLTSGLFGPGRLTLDLLSAYRALPPLPSAHLGPGPVALVVENSDTFDSIRRVLLSDPGDIGVLVWGAGAAFEQSVLGLAAITALSRVTYFGDLDVDGLRIPVSAGRRAVGAGLPDVEPATGLYELLLSSGVTGPGRVVTRAEADRHVAWLPQQAQARAAEVLCAGRRAPQEAVGVSVLGGSRDWIPRP